MELISKLGMSGKTTLIKNLYHRSTINDTISLILDAVSDEYVDQILINKLDSLFTAVSGNDRIQHSEFGKCNAPFSTTVIIDPDTCLINIIEHVKLMPDGKEIYDTNCIKSGFYIQDNPVHKDSLLLSQAEYILSKASRDTKGNFITSSVPNENIREFILEFGSDDFSIQKMTEIYLKLVTNVQQSASLTTEPVSMVYRLQIVAKDIDVTAPSLFDFAKVETREKTAYQMVLTSAPRFLIDPDNEKIGINSFLPWDAIVNSHLYSLSSETETYELMKSVHRDVYKSYEVYFSASSYRLDALSNHKKILSLHIGKEDNSRIAFLNSNAFQAGIDLMPGTYLRHITESKTISWITKDTSKHLHSFCLYNFHNVIVDNINSLLYTLLDFGSAYSGGRFTSAGKNFVQYLRQKGVNFAASNDLLFEDNNMNAISTNDHIRTALYAETNNLQPTYSGVVSKLVEKLPYDLTLESMYQYDSNVSGRKLALPDGTVFHLKPDGGSNCGKYITTYQKEYQFPFMSWKSDRFIPLTKSENLDRGCYVLEFFSLPFKTEVKVIDPNTDDVKIDSKTLIGTYKKVNCSPTTTVIYVSLYNVTDSKTVFFASNTISTVDESETKDSIMDQQYKQIFNYLKYENLIKNLGLPSSYQPIITDFLTLLRICLLTKIDNGILMSRIPISDGLLTDFFDMKTEFKDEFVCVKSLYEARYKDIRGKMISDIIKSLPFKFGAICSTRGIELLN